MKKLTKGNEELLLLYHYYRKLNDMEEAMNAINNVLNNSHVFVTEKNNRRGAMVRILDRLDSIIDKSDRLTQSFDDHIHELIPYIKEVKEKILLRMLKIGVMKEVRRDYSVNEFNALTGSEMYDHRQTFIGYPADPSQTGLKDLYYIEDYTEAKENNEDWNYSVRIESEKSEFLTNELPEAERELLREIIQKDAFMRFIGLS